MSATAAAAGSTPAPKSLVARIIGILVSPKETFQGVVAAPKWFGVLAVTTVLAAGFSALPLTTEGARQSLLDKQVQTIKSFGREVDDQTYSRMEKQIAYAPYTTVAFGVVGAPIIAAIFAGILFAIFNAALGGEASFKQVYAVVTHAGVVSTLGAVFGGIVNYLRQQMENMTNLGSLVPMLPEKSFVVNFLSAIDVFLVWWLIVLAMGLAVLYRRRTRPIAIALLSIYGVIAIAIAVFKSRGA
jgi:Yip1-like protein